MRRMQPRSWYLMLFLAVGAIVAVGGITRLTGSGLSMVHWHPVTGWLPPLTHHAWQEAYDAWRASPQGRANPGTTLGDFQSIFVWEFVHRVLARLIGLLALGGWVLFAARRRLRGRQLALAALLPAGVLLQGLLGWYMVRSGLVDVPEVSHLRLAAHLVAGSAVGLWAMWLWLRGEQAPGTTPPAFPGVDSGPRPHSWPWALLFAGIALQAIYGAFTAGLRGGYLYRTFPTFNGAWVPIDAFAHSSWWLDLVDHPGAVQFVHRVLGTVLVLAGWVLALHARRRFGASPVARRATGLAVALTAQLTLGVLTVLTGVSLPVAVAHQLGGYLVMATAVGVLAAAVPVRQATSPAPHTVPATAAARVGGSCV